MDRERVRQFVTAYLGRGGRSLLNRILPRTEFVEQRSLFGIARNTYLLTCLMLLHGDSRRDEAAAQHGPAL